VREAQVLLLPSPPSIMMRLGFNLPMDNHPTLIEFKMSPLQAGRTRADVDREGGVSAGEKCMVVAPRGAC